MRNMNKKSTEKALGLLDSCQLRKTRPRVEILSVLLEADSPLTQEQIAERIGETVPDKTTIYRTLMKLAQHNLIHQAYIQERSQYFEPAHHCLADQCHPHFTCVQCHQTHCLTEAQAQLVRNLPTGYQILRQQIRLEGLCAACRPQATDQE